MDANELLSLVREGRQLLAETGNGSGPLRCPGCERSVPDAKFCTGCGQRLRFPCPRCEQRCLSGEEHCRSCGVELTQEIVGERLESLEAAAERERERRARDPLRAFARTRVLSSGHVRHLLGTRADGSQSFVKEATSPTGRRLLNTEAKALEAIGEHAGVVPLRQVHREEGRVVVIMDYVKPSELRYPLEIARLVRIVIGALEVLEFVHGRGIVHCDLKPEHLVLPEGADRPVLIDWNIAQEPGPSRFGAYTPLFAAPEQIAGDRLDHRVDLYALGVILYLLFTHDRFPAVLEEQQGESAPEPLLRVFQAKKVKNRAYLSGLTQYAGDLQSMQMQQQQAPSADLEERRVLGAKYLFSSELSRTHDVNADIRFTGELLAVIQRATAVDPDDRYADAGAMKAALLAIQERIEGKVE